MANVSPISTLERQYRGVGQILVAIHVNAACCLAVQEAWKVQSSGTVNTHYDPNQADIPVKDAASDTTSTTVTEGTASDDPFSFLTCTPSIQSVLPPSPNNNSPAKKRNNFGSFLKKVAATSSKAIERGMHHLAVKADQGRTPDCLVMGLFDPSDRLLSATDAQRLPESRAAGVRFCIPLVLPASYQGNSVILKLFVRSGAALASSKHYLLAESTLLPVGQWRQHQNRTDGPIMFLSIPLNSPVVVDGLVQCAVMRDRKFTTAMDGNSGFFLQDPNPLTAYNNQSSSSMFHWPLDQSYAFSIPPSPQQPHRFLVATERTVESSVILPVAAAFAQLAAQASRNSLAHLQAVSRTVHEYRHDTPVGPEYAQVCLRVSHLQSNTASSSLLQNRTALVSVMLQRPNSIFEVEVLAPLKLPLHPTAAGGLRPDISCTFYPKPVRQGILPSLLQLFPGGRVPPTPGFLLGNVRVQITIPKRKTDPSGTLVAENPFDPLPVASSSLEEIWECWVPLEDFLTGRPSETKGYAVANMAGQTMGTIFLNFAVQMMGQPPPRNPDNTVADTSNEANGLAAGGLVTMTGLSMLIMDRIDPALDFDDTILVSSSSANPEQQRRRNQLATMGHFITHSYLQEHINVVRMQDCALLEDRALQYKQALEVANAAPIEATPAYKDRSPRPFRPSSSRTTMLLSGIGFNVHTGSMTLSVVEPAPTGGSLQKTTDSMFHNITSGAPADHARGFGNVFAAKEKSANPATTTGLKSPIGPVWGGLRRLEAGRKALAEEVSNQQTNLVMNIANFFVEKRHTVPVAGNSARPATHVPVGNVILQGMRWRIFEAVQCLHHLTWMCAMRRASVFSQALGIAVSSYLSSVSDLTKMQSNWPELWTRNGFLVSFEGLLSSAGKELGMIEDSSVGIDMLKMVSIILVPDVGDTSHPSRVAVPHSPYIRWLHLWNAIKPGSSGQEIDYILQIGIEQSFFEQRIPGPLKNGTAVRLVPILFEVGVDIFQAATNLGSNMSRGVTSANACEPDVLQVQEILSDDEDDAAGTLHDDVLVQLNYEAFQMMNAYAQSVSPATPVQATQTHQTHPLLATLFQHITSSSGKMNHDILVEAAEKAQLLGGGACVFCKSGKDRTAMHITYKQAQFMSRFRRDLTASSTSVDSSESGLSDTTLEDAMIFRLYGTRLPICEKNVGQAKYAFNSLQTKFMPEALKPPPSALAGFLKGGKVFGGGGGIES